MQTISGFSPNTIHYANHESPSAHTSARRLSSISYANTPDSAGTSSPDSIDTKFPIRSMGKSDWTRSKRKASARAITRRNIDTNRKDAGAWHQREEMMQHAILTKDLETELGQKIVLAKRLRDEMTDIIEKQKELDFEKTWFESEANSIWGSEADPDLNDEDEEFVSIYDHTPGPSLESWPGSLETFNFEGDQRISSTLVKDGSKLNIAKFESDLALITDEDVITKLNVPGGKEELSRILFLGAEARTTLMRSNIRLVVSISKKWMGRSFAAGNKEGARSVNLYSGGWDRPSLDEVIQEGVMGLARAVDKFDPSRGLRFSTYSTHWITSFVRQCFQTASTGCLKVPAQLHEIKVRMRMKKLN